MTVELEKRYTYIQKFFESLSDEEFVRMMIECGIKSSKKPEESDYIKAFYPNYMKQICIVVDEIRKGEIMNSKKQKKKLMTLVLHYNKDTYIRKVGLSGLFFVYILKYGKAIPGELSRYIESGDKLYDLVEQEMV